MGPGTPRLSALGRPLVRSFPAHAPFFPKTCSFSVPGHYRDMDFHEFSLSIFSCCCRLIKQLGNIWGSAVERVSSHGGDILGWTLVATTRSKAMAPYQIQILLA